MGTLNSRGEIDPSRGVIVTCVGKKRSGKSKMGLLWFESYPYDRIVIDINGTDGPHNDVIELHGTVADLPTKWPEHLREYDESGQPKRMTLRYHPDAGSPTFVEDVDAVLGLAWNTGRVCVILHEAGLIGKSTKTPAHMLRILQSNRHRQITAIFCMPRVHTANTLIIGQADLIYVFKLPNESDRDTVADTIGWDRQDFSLAVQELRGHGYLRADSNADEPAEGEPDERLVSVEPLPADVVAKLDRL